MKCQLPCGGSAFGRWSVAARCVSTLPRNGTARRAAGDLRAAEDFLQSLLDVLLQRKGIQALKAISQAAARLAGELFTGDQSLIGRLRRFVALAPVAAFAPLLHQLQSWQKEVHQRSPRLPIQFVDR